MAIEDLHVAYAAPNEDFLVRPGSVFRQRTP